MLRIKRQNMFIDMMRDYEVYIDGKLVGTIGNGEIKGYDLEPGHHLIHFQIDWCRSKKLSLDVKEDENIILQTGSSMRWFNFPFLYLFKLSIFRNNYLFIREEKSLTRALEMKYNPKLATAQ